MSEKAEWRYQQRFEEAERRLHRQLGWTDKPQIFVPLAGLVGFAAGFGLVYWAHMPTAAERQVCAQTVTTLLDTRDALELQRAAIILRQFDCRIDR